MTRVQLYPGMQQRVERLPGMLPRLYRTATVIAVEAKRNVESRRIADNIHVAADFDSLGPVARVNAEHWTSMFVEVGTIHQQPTAYLRKAMESGAARRVF